MVVIAGHSCGIIFIIIAVLCALGGFFNKKPGGEGIAEDYVRKWGSTSTTDYLLEDREDREKRQQWFFVAAGVLGVIGLILVNIPAPKSQ